MTTTTESSELLASTDASVVVDEDDDKVRNDILQAFYEGDKYKDIIFIVAKQEIPANAIIVKVGSPVLKTILENPTRNSTRKFALDDQNLEDFKKFIKFLYTNDCDITEENVIGLFLLGKKYNVPALSKKCMNYFENHLTSDNAPTYMAKTLMNPDLSEFSEKCLKVAPSATGVISVTNFFILDKYDKPKAVFLAEWILQILQQDRPDDYEEILFAKV